MGKELARFTGHEGPVKAMGKELARFTGHEGPVKAMSFSGDGKTLVTGSEDTTALVWDLARLIKRAPAGASG